MTLDHFFKTIGPYLEGQRPYEETIRNLYGPTVPADAHRISIYRQFCQGHRDTATGGVHQHLRSTVTERRGDEFWLELVNAYFKMHPMHHPEINENGAMLSTYLATREDLPGWWSALADFEWWEWQTVSALDQSPDAEPEKGPLRLGATVELRPYSWNLVAWLDDQNREGEPTAESVVVLFWRNRELLARRANTTPRELQVIKAVHQGLPVERDETFDDLSRAGIILGQ